MKKSSLIAVLLLLSLLLTACGGSSAAEVSVPPYYASTEDVTLETIAEKSVVLTMTEHLGGVEIISRIVYAPNEGQEDGVTTLRFVKAGDIIHINECIDLENGSYTHLYFTDDPQDGTLYMKSSDGNATTSISQESVRYMLEDSLFNFTAMDASILRVTEENGQYVAAIELRDGGIKISEISIVLDPKTGFPQSAEGVNFRGGQQVRTQHFDFLYGADIEIDETPKTDAPAPEDPTVLTFSTEDLEGNAVTEEMIRSAKLVMVNFWEPWCGPCVREMPDLEKLYETYKEKGLLILGVFSSQGIDGDVLDAVNSCNISYPILRCNRNLSRYTTDYVPTSVFFDGDGNLLSAEPVIGGHSYGEWEQMIRSYLGE